MPTPRKAGFQNLARTLLVALHFRLERVQGIELELVPNALNELDFHFAPIEIAVEIEEMNLKQGRTVIDCRAGAEAGDGGKGAPVDPRHDGVNSVSKPVGRLKRDIRRRHAKGAPQALARNHSA